MVGSNLDLLTHCMLRSGHDVNGDLVGAGPADPGQPCRGQDDCGHDPHRRGDVLGSSGTLVRDSVAAMIANLLPQATPGLTITSQGGYVGEGLPPVSTKIATKIQRGDFINMGELLPEFCAPPREDDPQAKSEAKTRRARSVQDIFTWIQCFGT